MAKSPARNATSDACFRVGRLNGVKDYVTRELFEQLMHDEEHHIDCLETQIDLV